MRFLTALFFATLLVEFAIQGAGAEPEQKERQQKGAGAAIGENKATPVERIRTAKDFKVELIYSIPAPAQGSWVNLCLDGKGRLIASDQYGGLYRFRAPPPGEPLDGSQVEKIPAAIRAANGLLWA